jgi:hypothetical protein
VVDLKIESKVVSCADDRMNEMKSNKRIQASKNGNGNEIHHCRAVETQTPMTRNANGVISECLKKARINCYLPIKMLQM